MSEGKLGRRLFCVPSIGRLKAFLQFEREFLDQSHVDLPGRNVLAGNSLLPMMVLALLWLIALPGMAASPKKVLIVHSFGSVAPPFTTHSVAFETALTEEMGRQGEQVDLDEVSLDMARYADQDMQEALVDYIRKRQAKWQPDLVVPIGSPAGVFVAQFRDRLFPETPIVYCGTDQRRLPAGALENNAAFVGENFNLPGFVEDILQVAPATTNIVVVIGASSLEEYWKAAFQREFEPFSNRVGFTWLDDLSFDQMLDRVGKLPPRSFIFLILLLRDATGVTHNADEALKRIHAVANAPVNGIFQNQLGLGIVGGRLYQAEQEGIESARIAARVLNGEPLSNFPPKIIGALAPSYDWRELQRWNIKVASLPSGSTVRFREPTLWERYRFWLIAGVSICLAQGLLIFVLVANLLRRRLAERSLRESEERMKLAAGAASLRLWEWDMVSDQICVTEQNPDAEPSAGFEETSFTDRMLTVHPDDRIKVQHALADSINRDGDYNSTHRVGNGNSHWLWIAERGRIEFGEKRKPLRMRGISIDITARKEAEDRASESEGRFLMMANSAPVLIWASGMDKKCTFLNQPWLNFTGRTLQQDLGDGWSEGVHPDDMARCLKTYTESFDARRPFTMEYRLRRHDGEYRWIADHGVPRYDADRNFLGYIGSCVDVTERRRAELEAQRSREELAHMSRVTTLGELGGSLAHELNQPLTAILSNAQAASRYLDHGAVHLGEVREILRDIVEEDRRAGEIITRMRAMLKKEEAKMLAQDLNRIIGEVLGIMRSEFLIRNVTPITRLAAGLPAVKGDRIQLQQVLLNLIVNACEAMAAVPPPSRQLSIETEKIDGAFVQVTVADHGPGFGGAVASAHKFEAFHTTKPNGLGLGLPICRSIIESHGGRLWCGNNGNGGGVVRFTILIDGQEKV